MSINNEDRADWAQNAVDEFARVVSFLPIDSHEEVIGDLLTDLMHLMDRHGLDHTILIDRAKACYQVEIADETYEGGKCRVRTP